MCFETKVTPFIDKCQLKGISRVQCLPSDSLPAFHSLQGGEAAAPAFKWGRKRQW